MLNTESVLRELDNKLYFMETDNSLQIPSFSKMDNIVFINKLIIPTISFKINNDQFKVKCILNKESASLISSKPDKTLIQIFFFDKFGNKGYIELNGSVFFDSSITNETSEAYIECNFTINSTLVKSIGFSKDPNDNEEICRIYREVKGEV